MAYKGMTIQELLQACNPSMNTDLESTCDMQDVLGRCTTEELVEAYKSDRVTFLRIATHCWNPQDLFTFYNRYLSPYIEVIAETKQEAEESIRSRDFRILELEQALEEERKKTKALRQGLANLLHKTSLAG